MRKVIVVIFFIVCSTRLLAQYCVPVVSVPGTEPNVGINEITLNGVTNTTAIAQGYVDYTGITINLVKGQSYDLTVNFGNAVAPLHELAAWIDWDANNAFALGMGGGPEKILQQLLFSSSFF